MSYTRREFGKLALAGLPATAVLGRAESIFGAVAQKPNSLIAGVQIGLIVPYSFGQEASDAETILKYVTQIGIGAVEMMNPPAEAYAGAPAPAGRGGGRPGGPAPGSPGAGGGGRGGRGDGRGGGRAELTPEQQAEQRARAEELKKWRLSVPMDQYKALRHMYNDAGVKIYAFKLGLTSTMSDEEYDYTFNVAEALGANHLTMELPTDPALTKRIGAFAEKRRMMVGYHAHTQATLTMWDEAISQSKYNGINLDAGHYVAGTSQSPIPLIQKHHDRITSMHLKDRKKDNGPNMPWGRGDTQLAEILQLMKKEKYKFPATIELEYPVPEGSTRVAEIGKCFEFCKRALGAASTTSASRQG
jgi:sugar phosphate isomerase/epimerase